MKKIFFLFSLCLFHTYLFAQNVKRLGLEGNYGFIIPHSQDLTRISQTDPFGFSIHYQNLKTDKKNWENCFCFHYLGLQFSYHNFGNPEIIGSASSLTGTFEPILWKNEKWTFSLLSSIGVSYLNKVYNEVSNPENIFFSAPISFLIYLTPKLEYSIATDWGMQMSFSYNHISNGGQRQPNKGINYPMAGLGLVRYFQNNPLPNYEKEVISKKPIYYLESGFSTQQGQDGREPNISLVFAGIKPLTNINGFGAGLELNKDFSLEVENSRIEALMPAPFISHHFLFGKIDFSQRMAMYIHKPVGYNEYIFYQRYVLNYNIMNQFFMGIGLKAHGHVAEHMDLRMGWKF